MLSYATKLQCLPLFFIFYFLRVLYLKVYLLVIPIELPSEIINKQQED